MILLSDIQYFPSIIYFVDLTESSNIVFDPYEHYQKMSFRNRTLVAGANGVITLSVPLIKGRHQKGPVDEIRISERENWQSTHWKTIQSCYNRSPWFEQYRDELYPLYHKPFHFLLDWDMACFEWAINKLALPVTVSFGNKSQIEDCDLNCLDRRNRILPKNYREFDPIVYQQVFEGTLGFLPNLSILDLLFCEGKAASALLVQKAAQNRIITTGQI